VLAAHVRSNHVHTVVEAEVPPERVMSDFKAYGSRHLNRMRLDEPNRKRWARHGSTRWLWKPQHVSAAIQYVVKEQGDAMSVFESHEL
jgi:REP element-mobilizing transposase RayT